VAGTVLQSFLVKLELLERPSQVKIDVRLTDQRGNTQLVIVSNIPITICLFDRCERAAKILMLECEQPGKLMRL
jgi:hypothetical protein